jgi:putative polymerase
VATAGIFSRSYKELARGRELRFDNRARWMSAAIAECVLILAVCFNAVLAVLNGHGVTLQRGHVVFAEIAIYAAALATLVFNADRRMLPWFLLALFIVVNGLLLCLGNGVFNPKYMRDVLVIPIFILLGMTYNSTSPTRPIIVLQTIVFGVGVLEALSPEAYSEIFQILKYYVSTRDFSQNSFWNSESTLFLSATRPGDRFFGFVNLHRVSSIFLEPVSLGNYCVIVAVFLIACWRELGTGARLYLAGSTAALIIGCDGRLAATSIVIVLIGTAFLRRFSSRWSFLYLPVILVSSALFAWSFNLDAGKDNFSGRLAGSIATLSQVNVLGLIGLDAQSSDGAADSGITYFILTQSFVGVIVIWLAICLLPVGRSYATRLYVHGIALFVPLNLMVSNSFFSIKVASLMWFYFGYLFLKDSSSETPSLSGGKLPVPIGRSALNARQRELILRRV